MCNHRSIIISRTVVLILTITQCIYAQIPQNILNEAKRILVYHSDIQRGTDIIRTDYHIIKSKIIGMQPEIIDSSMYSQRMLNSHHIAYSSHTGLSIKQYGRLIRIVEIDPHAMAMKLGLRVDDMILSVNGVHPSHLVHAWKLLQSHEDIVIQYDRNGKKGIAHCKAQYIEMKPLTINNVGNNIMIRINSFQASVLDEYTSFTKHQHHKQDTLILDIRNTVGVGELSSVLSLANMFIYEDSDILEYKLGSSTYTYTSTKKNGSVFQHIQVIMDSTTAGHALLFAGIMHHSAHAELIGTRSSSNGTLTSLIQLQESPPYYLAFPITHYVIRENIVLHERGLQPGTFHGNPEYTLK